MQFEWDENKSKSNIKKHNISFAEARTVFDDPLHISILDKRFDYFDERWITFGATQSSNIIAVGHLYFLADDGDEHIRIITARKATKRECEQYEEINH